MPELQSRKKKKTYTLPPDVQEYLRGVRGKGPEWGGEGLPEEWSNLSPQAIYDYVAQNDPYELYQIQLMDLFLRAKGIGGETEPGTWPEQGVQGVSGEISKMTDAQFQKVIDEAELKIKLGYPVEMLPFYEESRSAVGPNFWREYNSAVDAEVLVLAQEQEQVTQARQKLFDPYNLRSEGGRHNILSAVNQGLVTQEEADQALSKQWDWQNKQNPTFGGAKEAQAGLAKEAAGREKTAQQEQQMSRQSQLMKFLYPDLYSQYENEMLTGWGLGGQPAGTVPQTISPQTGGQAIASTGLGAEGAPTGTARVSGGTYIPQGWLEAGFSSWLDLNPNAKQAMTEKQYKMFTDNPNTYPAYMQYIGGFQPQGEQALPLAFDRWQAEDLTGKLLSEAEKKRKWEAGIAAKSRLAPITRNR